MICIVFWGIWYWRSKKVWEGKVINPVLAMESSFTNLHEWKRAKHSTDKRHTSHKEKKATKWCKPNAGATKVNVDASVFPGADTFSIGMVIRDCTGVFLEGKTLTLQAPSTVLEAESIGVREALSWVKARGDRNVIVETDSQLTVDALYGKHKYLLEVGHVIEQCKEML